MMQDITIFRIVGRFLPEVVVVTVEYFGLVRGKGECFMLEC